MSVEHQTPLAIANETITTLEQKLAEAEKKNKELNETVILQTNKIAQITLHIGHLAIFRDDLKKQNESFAAKIKRLEEANEGMDELVAKSAINFNELEEILTTEQADNTRLREVFLKFIKQRCPCDSEDDDCRNGVKCGSVIEALNALETDKPADNECRVCETCEYEFTEDDVQPCNICWNTADPHAKRMFQFWTEKKPVMTPKQIRDKELRRVLRSVEENYHGIVYPELDSTEQHTKCGKCKKVFKLEEIIKRDCPIPDPFTNKDGSVASDADIKEEIRVWMETAHTVTVAKYETKIKDLAREQGLVYSVNHYVTWFVFKITSKDYIEAFINIMKEKP